MRFEISIPLFVGRRLLIIMRTHQLSLSDAVAVLMLAGAEVLTPELVERLLPEVQRPQPPLEETFP